MQDKRDLETGNVSRATTEADHTCQSPPVEGANTPVVHRRACVSAE